MSLELPEIPGASHHRIRVGEVTLHLAELGEGEPIVLLHGWPQHHWVWRSIAPELARTRRVLMPDLRGWGWSDAPPGRYDKPTFARDVIGLMDELGVERFDLIGHDWGGWTSFLLALGWPERVKRMIALDIVPPWRPELGAHHLRTPLFLSYQYLVSTPVIGPRAMRSTPFVPEVIKLASGPDMHWTSDELETYAAPLREPARAQASSRCYRTFLTREVGPQAIGRGHRSDDLAVESLLLMGGASMLQRTFRPQPSRNLQVEVLPHIGHFIPEEAPGAVLGRAASFFAA